MPQDQPRGMNSHSQPMSECKVGRSNNLGVTVEFGKHNPLTSETSFQALRITSTATTTTKLVDPVSQNSKPTTQVKQKQPFSSTTTTTSQIQPHFYTDKLQHFSITIPHSMLSLHHILLQQKAPESKTIIQLS